MTIITARVSALGSCIDTVICHAKKCNAHLPKQRAHVVEEVHFVCMQKG